MSMSRPREYLHLGELAEWLGFADTRPVRAMVKAGLPVIRLSRKTVLVHLEDLRAFMEQRKQAAGDESERLANEILEAF